MSHNPLRSLVLNRKRKLLLPHCLNGFCLSECVSEWVSECLRVWACVCGCVSFKNLHTDLIWSGQRWALLWPDMIGNALASLHGDVQPAETFRASTLRAVVRGDELIRYTSPVKARVHLDLHSGQWVQRRFWSNHSGRSSLVEDSEGRRWKRIENLAYGYDCSCQLNSLVVWFLYYYLFFCSWKWVIESLTFFKLFFEHRSKMQCNISIPKTAIKD